MSTFGFVVPASAGALVCISNMCKGKPSMSAPDRPLTILGMLFPCHGIGDRAEVHRVFNGLPAPTDPSSPDTDNDGLSDSVETGTGIYVSASDTGTDPLNKDTDGDGFGFARSRARLEPERRLSRAPHPRRILEPPMIGLPDDIPSA